MKNKKSEKLKTEHYLPLVASFLFLFVGITCWNPQMTGYSVMKNVVDYELNLFGFVSFVLSMIFLLLFLRENKKK